MTDLYIGIAQKTVGGVELPFLAIVSSKIYEVTRFAGLTNHVYNAGALMASKAKFDRLEATHRAALALPQTMVDGTRNFVLLALPFFILAGLIMERGGISLRLVQFVHALVGHLRGGLRHVMVLRRVSGLRPVRLEDRRRCRAR